MDTYIRKQNKREKETKGNTHKRAEYCWGIQTLFMHTLLLLPLHVHHFISHTQSKLQLPL